MLYQKLTDTTITFPHVKLFLGNILLLEFFFGKSWGITYISKLSDKCQENLNIWINKRRLPLKNLYKKKILWKRRAKFLSKKEYGSLSWIPMRDQKWPELVCILQLRLGLRSTLVWSYGANWYQDIRFLLSKIQGWHNEAF